MAGGYRLVAIDAIESARMPGSVRVETGAGGHPARVGEAERREIGYLWRFTERQRSLGAATTVLGGGDTQGQACPLSEAGRQALAEFG